MHFSTPNQINLIEHAAALKILCDGLHLNPPNLPGSRLDELYSLLCAEYTETIKSLIELGQPRTSSGAPSPEGIEKLNKGEVSPNQGALETEVQLLKRMLGNYRRTLAYYAHADFLTTEQKELAYNSLQATNLIKPSGKAFFRQTDEEFDLDVARARIKLLQESNSGKALRIARLELALEHGDTTLKSEMDRVLKENNDLRAKLASTTQPN